MGQGVTNHTARSQQCADCGQRGQGVILKQCASCKNVLYSSRLNTKDIVDLSHV